MVSSWELISKSTAYYSRANTHAICCVAILVCFVVVVFLGGLLLLLLLLLLSLKTIVKIV